jgi:hypothetical protein
VVIARWESEVMKLDYCKELKLKCKCHKQSKLVLIKMSLVGLSG